jgi:hypothetical protein
VRSVVTDAGEFALHVATGKRVEFDHVRTGRGVMTLPIEFVIIVLALVFAAYFAGEHMGKRQ